MMFGLSAIPPASVARTVSGFGSQVGCSSPSLPSLRCVSLRRTRLVCASKGSKRKAQGGGEPEGDTSSAQPEEEKSAGSADTEAKDTADRKNVEPKREMEANPEGAEPVEEGVAGSKKGDVAPDNSVTAEAAAIKAEAEVQPQAQSPATGPSRSGGSGKNERSAGSPNDRSAEDEVRLIEKLLASVSGLDRGLVASGEEQAQIDNLCRELERGASSQVDYRQDDSALRGLWRLVYSSAFAVTRSLGGSRPGPPAFLAPFRLGQVTQRIRPGAGTLDNNVELLFPPLPGLPPPPVLQACLRHEYEAVGRLTTRIVFTETILRTAGDGPLGQLPSINLPTLPENLQPPRDARAATFDNTYVGRGVRISRGDRGELRVYVAVDEQA